MKRWSWMVLLLTILLAAVWIFWPEKAQEQSGLELSGEKISGQPESWTGSRTLNLSSDSSMPIWQEPSDMANLLSVPYISQEEQYPTGCESVSAVMLLQYWGVSITVDEFIDEHLSCGALYWSGGKLYGPDPNDRFVGNPRETTSYGCYAPVIERALHSFLLPSKLRVLNRTGAAFTDLTTYIDRGEPVLIWATIDMKTSYPGAVWTDEATGLPFQWTANEHCLVLVGYDDDYYYCNDPYQSRGLVGYPRALLEQRYQEMGSQAIALSET